MKDTKTVKFENSKSKSTLYFKRIKPLGRFNCLVLLGNNSLKKSIVLDFLVVWIWIMFEFVEVIHGLGESAEEKVEWCGSVSWLELAAQTCQLYRPNFIIQ